MAFINLHQTVSVGEGSDHLQLIQLWPSNTPGKGVCSGAKKFGSALLQPACSICVSECFFIVYVSVPWNKVQPSDTLFDFTSPQIGNKMFAVLYLTDDFAHLTAL